MTYKDILMGICALATLAIVVLFHDNLIYSVLLLATISACMLALERDKASVIVYVFCFIFGALAEIIAIYFGAWTYSSQQFAGIPFYLSFVWGNAGVFIKSFNELIKKI
jgi:uncharacterized membrane protein YoaT (DUF817 family)